MGRDLCKIAEEFVAMVARRDADAVDDLLVEDYIDHNPLIGNGREANRAFWSAFFTAFPDVTATLEDCVADGDRLVGRFTYRGTHKGVFFGVDPTGNDLHMRTIDIWRVEDGRLAEHWDEINLLEVLQQIDVIPTLDITPEEQPA
ncbi:ester cyclase [Actinomadura sp. NEAU-AAG7]|uniref:ester cyclase n=1 Tax=Actinomadura sp. NEAU-AAG7 TaxID=2839640 RepID=UPI001BE3E9E5|nr:ester cyclase [Actinomadura sp. NEAU-AAG7]MBT2212413.1 ester cyclase [Actinomadura sp. NEAU-AAG7]